MTVPTDDKQDKVVDLHAAMDALRRLAPGERVSVALELSAQFLEFAAFEMASDHPPDEVADLIVIAARLDQASRRMSDQRTRGKARNM